MNFELKVNGDGKVNYFRVENGAGVGSSTPKDSAMWMLSRGKPYKGEVYEGFEVAVKYDGADYHFEGKWNKTSSKNETDELKIEPKVEPVKKRRRIKDRVCE